MKSWLSRSCAPSSRTIASTRSIDCFVACLAGNFWFRLPFDEAIIAGKKALRHNPWYPGPYRCLASAFAHLGRDAEAREAAARVLKIDPAFTISAWIARSQLSKSAKLMIEGFRKAGLPE
jgi:tetratricopeptide (TPR) repeat protein